MAINQNVGVLSVLVGFGLVGCAGVNDAESVDSSESALTLTAPVDLVAIGKLGGALSDLSAATSAPLENGVAGNLLGGLGSGLAHADGDTFLGLPDRGPNAVSYNAAVDHTTSYIPRVQTLKLKLRKAPSGSALPFALEPSLQRTTLLFDKNPLVYGSGAAVGLGSGAPALNRKHAYYFSGRSDNFDPALPSTDPNNGRFDPESVRVSPDGKHLYISDEYGPYVYQFDRQSGRRERVFALPADFAVTNLSAVGDTEITGNLVGRVANKGMEGLALTPGGRHLVGVMQSPLLQDGGTAGRYTRIVKIDVKSGAVEQYLYELTNIGTAAKPKYPTVSDILAVNDHEFLLDERDGKGLGDDSAAVFKQIHHIDLTGAPEVTGISGEANLAGLALPKTLFLDVVASLNAHGVASIDIPAKLEGIAFGPDIRSGRDTFHTLYLASDNDFLPTLTGTNHPDGVENPNQFFVFAFDAAALPGLDSGCH